MKFTQADPRNATATSLVGYVNTTYDELCRTFGDPNGQPDGDKVNVEWVLRFTDGTIATIYDWKESRIPLDVYEWHVGGFRSIAVRHVTDALGII